MRIKKVIINFLLLASFLTGLLIFAASQNPKLDPEIKGLHHFLSEQLKLIVIFSFTTSSSQVENKQKSLNGWIDKPAIISKDHSFYKKAKLDFEFLRQKLDGRLFQVRSINLQIRDKDISKEELASAIPIQIDKQSSLNLEIEAFSQDDTSEKLTIIQLSYTDINNGNKVHEFSRMYLQSKKKPD